MARIRDWLVAEAQRTHIQRVRQARQP